MTDPKPEDFILNLDDLKPQEAHFKLSKTGDTVHTLKPYSLRVQLWAAKQFGSSEIERALNTRDALILSQIAWEVLKDRTPFKDFDAFLEAVVTFADRAALVNAVFETVGMSQPVLEKLAKQIEEKSKAGNAPSPEPTGAESLKPSPLPTPPTRKSKRS